MEKGVSTMARGQLQPKRSPFKKEEGKGKVEYERDKSDGESEIGHRIAKNDFFNRRVPTWRTWPWSRRCKQVLKRGGEQGNFFLGFAEQGKKGEEPCSVVKKTWSLTDGHEASRGTRSSDRWGGGGGGGGVGGVPKGKKDRVLKGRKRESTLKDNKLIR